MNFLAHLKLSNDVDDLMIGNFIADSVRKVEYQHFKPGVIAGIELHHKIDFFTDHHPIVEQSKERLRPRHHKYSGVVVDILYDHYLARKFSSYHNTPLPEFAKGAYSLFHNRWSELPPGVQHMLPFMEANNWLVNYGEREGLERVFSGMSRRANFKNEMGNAVDDLFDNYHLFEQEFDEYFPLLLDYTNKEIANLDWQR